MVKTRFPEARGARTNVCSVQRLGVLCVALAAMMAVVGVAPGLAQDGCASCTFYENSLAPARATLDHLRQAREIKAQEMSDAIGEAMDAASGDASGQLSQEGWRQVYRELTGFLEGLDAAIAAQQSWVAHLEAALLSCQQRHCSATGGAGGSGAVDGSFSVAPSGEYSYQGEFSDECFRQSTTLERLYLERDRLEEEVAAAQAGADKVRAEHERLSGLMMQSMDKVEIDESFRHPEDTGAQIRGVRMAYQGMNAIREAREAAEAKLQEALDRLEALQEEIRNEELDLEDCEDRVEEPTSLRDRFDVWVGVSGNQWSWDHPQEAVGSFLDAVDVPGATESSSTDAEDTTAGIELGIRFPVLRKPCGTFFLGLGLSLFDGPSFSSRGEIMLESDGVMFDAIVDFRFEADEIVAPQLVFRYESNRRFYFETGTTYFETPMELRITESYFLNGQLDEQMVSTETVDDSGFGFVAELGWSGERWDLGLSYRQVEINTADLETLGAHLKLSF